MGGCLKTCCASEAGLRCHSVLTLCGFAYFVTNIQHRLSCLLSSKGNSITSNSNSGIHKAPSGPVSSLVSYSLC